MKYLLLFILLPLSLCSLSCSGERGGSDVEEEQSASGEIRLSKEQFESANLKIGVPESRMFSTSIRANGYIVPSRRGGAEISSPISGRVKQINFSTGDYVKEGAVLFLLESSEIILLQQSYAEAFQHLKLLKSDFERLKSLSEENIVAQKDYLRAESDYRSLHAKVEGLKARLFMIHIDPAKVEEGVIEPYLSVKAPINGSITRQELVLGQYIEIDKTPIEIIDTQQFRLSLQVFENSISALQIGQRVLFSTPDNPDQKFTATLNIIGKAVSEQTRSIQCYAVIEAESYASFLNKMYVEAEIITCEREALALPEVALIREPDKDYVLLLVEEKENHLTFRKMPVRTGVTRQGYTEILEEDLGSLLLSGVYNLLTEE